MKPKEPVWMLSIRHSTLGAGRLQVSLTRLETLILSELACGREGAVSKDQLIARLGRDSEQYSGLEMCLSRLQRKFRQRTGQPRLFVAVRNRGYRLTQRVKLVEQSDA